MSARPAPDGTRAESPDPDLPDEGDEVRERSPATIALGVAWVVVYLAMAFCQGTIHARGQAALSGGVEARIAHEFGTMSPQEVRGGQPWRALTAAFIHFSILHLGFNLLMFYQLGREVESWYGPWLFLAVVVVIGTGGNLLSAWLKPYFGQPLTAPSAGGSGVVCGLIALIATVGWRSRTPMGGYVKAQMVGLLAFVAVIGWVIPGVDNVVHGSGAFFGVLVGLLHRRLWPRRGSGSARLAGLASLALIVACALAQARVGYFESRADDMLTASRQRAQAIEALARMDLVHQQLERLGRNQSPLGQINPYAFLALSRQLDVEMEHLATFAPELARGRTARAFERVRALAKTARTQLPSVADRQQFVDDARLLLDRLREDQAAMEREFARAQARLGFRRVEPGGARPGTPSPGPPAR